MLFPHYLTFACFLTTFLDFVKLFAKLNNIIECLHLQLTDCNSGLTYHSIHVSEEIYMHVLTWTRRVGLGCMFSFEISISIQNPVYNTLYMCNIQTIYFHEQQVPMNRTDFFFVSLSNTVEYTESLRKPLLHYFKSHTINKQFIYGIW